MRLARTVLIGTVAAALGIWWLGRAYDVESGRLVDFLLSSALLVVGCIALAALAGTLLGMVRRRHQTRMLGRAKQTPPCRNRRPPR